MKLLGTGNPKTMKGEKKGYLTYILHLAPSDISGYNVCPCATKGCRAACLNTAGRGRFDNTQNARIRKTNMFFQDRDMFLYHLTRDIEAGIRKAERDNMIPCFRLNGTSDIRWENYPVNYKDYNIFELFPEYQFYDYTKISNRRDIPSNYHLTFSQGEDNHDNVLTAMYNGMNIAVVFNTGKKDELPSNYLGRKVLDGDESDLRFLDDIDSIIGLRAKGKAKQDVTGFVVTV